MSWDDNFVWTEDSTTLSHAIPYDRLFLGLVKVGTPTLRAAPDFCLPGCPGVPASLTG